jgi:EAL domain-containing protein (putative c-di-GMP-specific phosphodiesterase class I)
VFDAVQDRSVRGHHESIEHISRALVEREFTLYYQPKVNLRSGAVIGAEALIRWQHPQKGLLAPAAFLPVIEDHPLAIEIGEWVIESALSQMETWRAAGLELPVSVNVGAHQLQQPDFVQRLHALLLAHPAFRPGDLEIEVLETSALEDIARVSMVIGACRELGVAFALDDFGTGYSSLTYLKRLAVTVLKIDQSFVHDMLDDPDDLAILEGVIGLASAFRRVAIAEGVETMEHGKMLLQLGCDLAQGYGIARPMPADQMPAWAAAWITPPAWANCQQISHDNRPLLHAAVEHRAWIVAEEHYLKGERAAPPALDPHHCRFGLWLEAERRAGRGDQPGFSAIDTLHQQIHALADELCQLRTEGRAAESVARLGELYGLCNALIGQMKALEQ